MLGGRREAVKEQAQDTETEGRSSCPALPRLHPNKHDLELAAVPPQAGQSVWLKRSRFPELFGAKRNKTLAESSLEGVGN